MMSFSLNYLYQVAFKDSSSSPPAQEQLLLSTSFERNLVLVADPDLIAWSEVWKFLSEKTLRNDRNIFNPWL